MPRLWSGSRRQGFFVRRQALTNFTHTRTANIFLPAFAYPENNLHGLHFLVANLFPWAK